MRECLRKKSTPDVRYALFFFFFSAQFSMKLRNRTTRVISDVKQEDCKPAPNATEKSTSILASSSNSCGLIIKQEDTKDDKTLLEQHGKIVALFICSN